MNARKSMYERFNISKKSKKIIDKKEENEFKAFSFNKEINDFNNEIDFDNHSSPIENILYPINKNKITSESLKSISIEYLQEENIFLTKEINRMKIEHKNETEDLMIYYIRKIQSLQSKVIKLKKMITKKDLIIQDLCNENEVLTDRLKSINKFSSDFSTSPSKTNLKKISYTQNYGRNFCKENKLINRYETADIRSSENQKKEKRNLSPLDSFFTKNIERKKFIENHTSKEKKHMEFTLSLNNTKNDIYKVLIGDINRSPLNSSLDNNKDN